MEFIKEVSQKYNQQSTELSRKLLNNYGVVNTADILNNLVTPYGEAVTVNKHPIINLQSHHPLSVQRDQIYVDGVYYSGSYQSSSHVTHDGRKYTVPVSEPNKTIIFDTAQMGVYISGYWAETGLGTIVNDTISENVRMYWGNFDDFDGWGWMKTGNDLYICIRRYQNGTTTEELIGQNPNQPLDTTTDKTGWNIDMMDTSHPSSKPATNPSMQTLKTSRGHMYQTRFTHYGFGQINFYINLVDKYGHETRNLIHKYERQGDVVINNPNLPIRVEVKTNANFTGSESIHIGGRQMSVLGDYLPLFRSTSEYRLQSVGGGGTWYPLVSAKQDYVNNRGIQALIDAIFISTDQNLRWSIFLNPILTGTDTSFQVARNTADDARIGGESSILWNTTATGISGGVKLTSGIVSATKNEANLYSDKKILTILPKDRIVTLAVKNLTAQTATTISSLILREEF